MVTAASSRRIAQLDTVRGMAILGIFLLNIFGFALPQAAYLNPYYTSTTSPSEAYIWVVFNVLFQGKVLTIFSILFGATLALLQSRTLRWNHCRLFILAIFGVIHGVLFWDGDILLAYALTGLVAVYLINYYSDRVLLNLAVTIYLVGLIILFILGSGVDPSHFWQISAQQVADEQMVRIAGGIEGVIYRTTEMFIMVEMLVIQYGWQLLALMVIGALLIKNGWLKGQFSPQHYRKIAKLFIVPALVVQIIALYAQSQLNWSYFATSIVGYIINELVTPFQSLGYIALVYGFWGKIQSSKLVDYLQNVGRMALSNYILQTLICTTIFYHLGYFGVFSRVELLLFIPIIWAINLLFSHYWLRVFRQGPLEWCWRTLTEKLYR
ncbi:DUF418 domain-containing protein [Providencia rettgeri]|uniref:DUF418 domain-containing protein YeiB n=1 Tax=Providencia TaxID=586 RepID=UPI00065E4FA6|nr:DUF418 domain-containing protein YeiB [Providencia rettgeri]EJD6499881.1 DUF418 domain-containing protein [Providencia rettgeri]EJD6643226.1 DUF418 domain-containing protein [Providencia rettgeri]ELL9154712.1 DUF418 domain-containing protein [Providencia rettgeri]ELR5048982.1 DUF418 domain-containing protein [Providencia rettgeri]ELR5061788.1 DUF418 domain-containing protein [Providencia rettgeri]